MSKKRCTVLLGCLLLGISGCGRGSEPVEVVMGDEKIGYADEVKLSEEKKLNYEGFFLGEGVSSATALDLFGESLDSLVYGWNWELSMNTYTGTEVKLEEGEDESLWGKEVEKPKEEDKEEGKEEESKEETKEGQEEAKEEQGEVTEEQEEVVEEEPEIIIETTGSSEKLSEIVSKETVLKKGQVFSILPVYVEPVVEETDEDTEGAEPEDREGTEEDAKEKSSEGEKQESEEAPEALEEVESLKEVLRSIVIVNYSSEDATVKSCVENSWYTIRLDNYIDCFDLKPLENEEVIPENEVFQRISELLGNPTIVWEKPMQDKEYVEGVRRDVFAYEFPEYVLLAEITETDSVAIDSMYYIPNGLWNESEGYTGMKNVYRGAYIELDKSVLPEIE